MAKSPDAFRTISEVADWLGVQAHVLRFWESKFSQVKPIKRAGGRRYYRPADMLLLGGIKKLLHDDGLTIKGVQKLLREHGINHVADQSQPLDDLTMAVIESDVAKEEAAADALAEPPVPDDTPAQGEVADAPAEAESADKTQEIEAPIPEEESASEVEPVEMEAAPEAAETSEPELDLELADPDPAPTEDSPAPEIDEPASEVTEDASVEGAPPADLEDTDPEPIDVDAASEIDDQSEPEDDHIAEEEVAAAPMPHPDEDVPEPAEAAPPQVADAAEPPVDEDVAEMVQDEAPDPIDAAAPDEEDIPTAEASEPEDSAEAEPTSALPSFIRRPLVEPAAPEPEEEDTAQDAADASGDAAEMADLKPAEPSPDAKPRVIDIGPLPDEADMPAAPAALSALIGTRSLGAEQQDAAKPLLAQLVRLRASMANPRKDAPKD